jgi:NTE family protein
VLSARQPWSVFAGGRPDPLPRRKHVMTRPRIGLARGSGFARGRAHVGVIDALIEAGIEPDIVCGRLNELRQWAEAATWREVIGLLDVRLAGGGLISGNLIVAFVHRFVLTGPIESYSKR